MISTPWPILCTATASNNLIQIPDSQRNCKHLSSKKTALESPTLVLQPWKKWVILLAQVAGVSSALSIIILLRVLLVGGPTPTEQTGCSSRPTPTARKSRFSPKNGKEKQALEVDQSPDVPDLEEDLEDLCFRNRDLVHKIEWSPKISQNEEAKQASKVDGSSDMPDLQDLCFRKNRDLVQKIEWSPKTSRSPAENEYTRNWAYYPGLQ